jgi:hypothetical protein
LGRRIGGSLGHLPVGVVKRGFHREANCPDEEDAECQQEQQNGLTLS